MDIKSFVDLNELQRIQDLFSDVTGLAAITVDTEGNDLTKGSNFTAFCLKYSKENEKGLRRCVNCGGECTGIHLCHAGLMNFSSDIFVNGERAGAVIGGQVFPQAPDYNSIRAIAGNLEIDESEYAASLKQVPVRSEMMVRASAEMFSRIVEQFINLEYLKKLNSKKINVIYEEIPKALNMIITLGANARTLQGIASRGHMLASNASEEAGRAGTAGVGFAVVAREIGRLSEEASSTYIDIDKQINSIEASLENIKSVQI